MLLGAAKTAKEWAKSQDEFEARPAWSLCSRRNIRQSITQKIAHGFAEAKFAFWIQAAISNVLFRSRKQTEDCECTLFRFPNAE
jgi:hypothetical protein